MLRKALPSSLSTLRIRAEGFYGFWFTGGSLASLTNRKKYQEFIVSNILYKESYFFSRKSHTIWELISSGVSGSLCVCVCAQSCLTLLCHGLLPARLLCTWNFPGKNTGAGWHFLFQGIFLTQGLNPRFLHLLHWQVGYSPLCCLGSPLGSLVPHNTNFKLAFLYSRNIQNIKNIQVL